MSVQLTTCDGQPAVYIHDAKGAPHLYLAQVTVDIPGRWVVLFSKLSEDRAELEETYEVSCNGSEWGCCCADWRFRFRRNRTSGALRDCKHIECGRDFRAALLALQGARPCTPASAVSTP